MIDRCRLYGARAALEIREMRAVLGWIGACVWSVVRSGVPWSAVSWPLVIGWVGASMTTAVLVVAAAHGVEG